MSFWIKVDVIQTGQVIARTFSCDSLGAAAGSVLRERRATTVSQVLRSLAASMVTAKAEKVGDPK